MINLIDYGYDYEETEKVDGLLPARITEFQRERYKAVCSIGEVEATLKGSFAYNAQSKEAYPAVGDFVLLEYNETGSSRISHVLPRKTKFSRADVMGHKAANSRVIFEQVVATNFDYVFILSSLNADFNTNRILRYLSQARQSGGRPVVILTKADLADDIVGPEKQVRRMSPDVPVHVISSHSGYGMEELAQYLLPGKTIVFLGMSGVGKSSLLNAMMEQEVMEVSGIREADSRGRHTTTHRQLFMLPSGAMVIDTPGMRELGLFDAEEGIKSEFSEIEELIGRCKYGDCRHETEPGCAVLTALEDGSLSSERWKNYLAHMRENKFMADRVGYMSERRDRHKSIAKYSKELKKKRGYR